MSAIEESFIDACLMAPELVAELDIEPKHFASKYLGNVWNQIRQGNTDPVNIVHELGEEYEPILHACLNSYSQTESLKDYAEKIIGDHERRSFLFSLTEARQKIEEGSDIDQVIQSLLRKQGNARKSSYAHISDVVTQAYNKLERHDEDKFIPTGFSEVDFVTGGAERGTLIIIAGRPSMGKTAYALGACLNAAATHSVCFSSIEMDRESVGYRMLSSVSEMDLKLLRTGAIKSPEAWRKAAGALEHLQKLNFYIDDNPSRTPSQIISQCKKLMMSTSVDVLMVDYIGLLTPERKNLARHEQIAEMTRAFKRAAKEMNIAVMLLCQLNREAEGVRPNMSMLRDSGAIEQDADVVLFPYRFINEGGEEDAEIIIGKNRNGPTATVAMKWQGATASYKSAIKI